MDEQVLNRAVEYALSAGGSGCVVRHGKAVAQWGDQDQRYDLKSSTKSIGITALGLALLDGKMQLADKAVKYHPGLTAEGGEPGWRDEITIFHLITHTAGYDKPGGTAQMLFRPGTMWSYSDSGPNWLAECLTLVYQQDLSDLLFERVFTPLGITKDDLQWRKNLYRPEKIDGLMRREFGSGIHANVDAMARIGLLYLRAGAWGGKQIIPAEFVRACATTPDALKGLGVYPTAKNRPGARNHYGLLWWNNNDGALGNVPRDTFWAWGLHDSLIVVMPSLDIVVARAGAGWKKGWDGHYSTLEPFLDPIVASVRDADVISPDAKGKQDPMNEENLAPYPPSEVIASLGWAPVETIIRRAEGSDNWPMTWADDGRQYTAYGDGWGFEPKVEEKLSLGFARVEGPADDFKGINIRSQTGEQTGNGPRGKKASGMLCVDGSLYMFVRNADNAQLAWSEDHGRTWSWAGWRFTTSFGCPTFLNFGRDYQDAPDQYVYVYSFDSETAYDPADRMVLARVPKDRIRRREAYEYFVARDESGRATWSDDIAKRGAVFEHKGRCYRSGVTYNAGIQRYLWVQAITGRDSRHEGGIAVYDAPQPWGPWTTVYYTEHWDTGPGESASFPTKWMSEDGLTVHLVFSGEDAFSVRKATLTLRRDE